MTAIASKVCIVGDFAVGKTSLTERFVRNHFSEKYLTTVGVKIDTKEIRLDDLELTRKLVIWDVAGTDRFGAAEFAYLRGAAGYLYVADGTRPATIDAALALRDQAIELYGQRTALLLINKRDLDEQWRVSDERLDALSDGFDGLCLTSAKSGENVEAAFVQLADTITRRELDANR